MAPSRVQRAHLIYGWGHRRYDLRLYGVTGGRTSARDAEGLLSRSWLVEQIQPALNVKSAQILTWNKWVFYRLLDGSGIPIPRTLGLYDPVHGVSWDGQRRLRTPGEVLEEVRRERPAGLVLKPVGGQQGQGLLILDDIDYATGASVARTGVEVSLEDAVAGLTVDDHSEVSGYLLQEPVPSHELYQELAPWTTNTIRVVTIVDRGGDVHVQAAATLLGRRGNMANNWHAGGINVAVDVETGVMGHGLLMGGPERLSTHPDSGAPFTGRAVPDWEEVLRTVRRAALLLPGMRSVGWDVVATPTGPVVLEGNGGWDLRMMQVHGRGFLSDDRIRSQLVAAGAALPTGSLVKGTVGQVRSEIRGQARRWLPRTQR